MEVIIMNQKQKAEANFRMQQLTKALNLNPNLCNYLEESRIYYSYVVAGLFGCVDTLSYDKRYLTLAQEFEKKHNAYVYHAIESHSAYGTFLSLLYVSENEEDWPSERLEKNYITAFCYNVDTILGESGDIFVASDNGAIIRIDL